MHYRIRKAIFLVFFAIFLIGAPLLVLYTAGYRINLTNFRIQQTGVIALSSTPRGASVFLNGTDTGAKTPHVIQRLSPGNYTVSLSKTGYLPWEQRVEVTSGETTYSTATLFADAQPELLQETAAIDLVGDRAGRFISILLPFDPATETQSVLRYDTITHVARIFATLEPDPRTPYWWIRLNTNETTLIISGEAESVGIALEDGEMLDASALQSAQDPLPGFTFTDNGTSTEFRDANAALIALLPPGAYTVTFTNETYVMFADTRNRSYLYTRAANTVTQISFPTHFVDENGDGSMFAGSDGNEIDIFDPTTGATTLLARQSDPIVGIAWHTDDQSVLCATPQSIFSVARESRETREMTMLVSHATIRGIWPDTTGKNLIFFGTIENVTGLWSLALTQ